ncbi:hypothetical protein GCM10020216_033650 [Nonomuraea helvata]
MASILAALMIARVQLSKSMAAAITWTAYDDPSRYVRNSRWTVHIKNGGPGRAIVSGVVYRVQIVGAVPAGEHWVSWWDAVAAIQRTGLRFRDDFFILALGEGAAIPPSGPSDTGLEIFSLNSRAASKVAEVLMRVQVDDVIGDKYERTITCWHAPSRQAYAQLDSSRHPLLRRLLKGR